MNNQTLRTKIIAILSLSTLVMVGLEGCYGIQNSVVEPEPVETEMAEVNFAETDLVESSTAQVEIEATSMSEPPLYSNETYGFKFNYPNSWTLTEEDHGIILKRGTNRLIVNFRWVEEDIPHFGPSGLGAGDFIYKDKICFLDQIIPVEALSYKGKTKAVFYGKTGYVDIGNLMFLILLEDLETDYLDVNLPEEIMNEAKTILESFMWIGFENGSKDLDDQPIEQQDGVDYSRFWVSMEDSHYGVRFAVPCFWSVEFPKEYRPGGIAYPIWNYTEEYSRSFGKNESGVWENGGIKIDMNFISGEVFGIPPGVSLSDFATMLTDHNPEVGLVSTEELTINNQASLLVTRESIFGISQFYLFHISEDIYLIFSPIRGTIQNPDVQAILHLIAIHPDIQVDIPQIMPGKPPDGLEAPCLELSPCPCTQVNMLQISKQDASGMDQTIITGALFSQYLEQFLNPTVPACCKLISFSIIDVSIDPALDNFAKEQQVDWVAWATYSVQAENQEYWIAGNGVLGEDGWILDKTVLVGVTDEREVYKLTIHGTGP